MTKEAKLDCPSAPHDHAEARLIGVVLDEGGQPRVSYTEKGARFPDTLDLKQMGVDPAHALRFAAPCANMGCGQWREGGCGLGKDIVKHLQPVVDVAPACTLRATCRWFAENGVASCLRCPQIATRRRNGEAVAMAAHALPSSAVGPTGGATDHHHVRVAEGTYL